MRLGITLAAIAGVGLGIALVLHYGAGEIGEALLAAGWKGVLAVSAAYFFALVVCAAGWRVLLIGAPPRALWWCVWARWVRESTGTLLALTPAAGGVIAARELTLRGVPVGAAGASTVVDLTMETAAQALFTVVGLALLNALRPGDSNIVYVAAGAAVLAAAVAGFIIAQRKGLFRFLEQIPERLGWTKGWGELGSGQRIHDAIETLYRDHKRLGASFLTHFAGWFAGAAEALVALWFMGHPLGFTEVIVIESMVFALRSAAFVVPWTAGIQEGGYILAGALFGLSPEVALALSLLKRVREIATGVPNLILWQVVESRRLLKRTNAAR